MHLNRNEFGATIGNDNKIYVVGGFGGVGN